MTSIQNRTIEFQQCVTSFNKLNKNKTAAGNGPNKVNKSEFSLKASVIAKDIAHTTELLSKLALLAKKKPMFDDKPIEVSELTYVIKQDIFKVEKNIKALQDYVRGNSNIQIDSQITQYSKNVLNLLNSKMKNISGDFKSVLEVRQKNEQLNKTRTEQFLSAVNTAANGANMAPNGSSRLPISRLNTPENPFLSSYNPDQDPDISVPNEYLSIPDQTRQLLLMEEQQSSYLQERNRAVETIESTINEVGNLFSQLATMVSEQGEVIQRIDQNVEDISLNVTGAQRELLKYYANISNNRWLYVKVFGILIIFFLLWVLVS